MLVQLLFQWINRTDVISARTRTDTQPLEVDLKRIDIIPFRGLLQAAGVETKTLKAWAGYSCFNNETEAALQSQQASVRSPLLLMCGHLMLSTNRGSEWIIVSCFWLAGCYRVL